MLRAKTPGQREKHFALERRGRGSSEGWEAQERRPTEIAVSSFGETHGYKQYWKRATNLLQGEKKRERIE